MREWIVIGLCAVSLFMSTATFIVTIRTSYAMSGSLDFFNNEIAILEKIHKEDRDAFRAQMREQARDLMRRDMAPAVPGF